MKFSDILQTASSNMLRSKVRSLLTIIAIFIGALTLTLTNGIGAGVSTYIDEQLGNLGADDVLIVQAKVESAAPGDPQEYNPDQTLSSGGIVAMPVLTDADIEKIRSVPGIISAEPSLSPTPDYIQGVNDKKFSFTLQPYIDGSTIDLTAGESLSNSTTDNEILLSISYVEALGFSSNEAAVGQTVRIGITSAAGVQQEVEARVVGVQEQSLLSTGGGGQSNKVLTEALVAIQTEGLPEAQVSQYMMATARFDVDATEDELQAIKDALDEAGFSGATIDDRIGIFKQVIDAIVTVLNAFAGITLLAASFGIVNTLFMAVQERTKEIGLMKAMGMRGSRIFALFSIEAVLLGFWGSLLGVLAGMGVGQVVNRIASDSFLKDLPGFDLLVFPVTSVSTIMLVIMAIAFLAGTLPARRASKKDPIEALRYE